MGLLSWLIGNNDTYEIELTCKNCSYSYVYELEHGTSWEEYEFSCEYCGCDIY